MSDLQLDIIDGTATITLNRADKKNALTRQMWQQLPTLLQRASNEARVLILRGAGSTFCAGADIAELHAHIADLSWMRANHIDVQNAALALHALPIPSIAVLQGAVYGGGLGLACACDFRFAQNDCQFALTPAKLGLSYSLTDTARIVDLVGIARTKELLLSAQPWPAYQALTYGLVHEVHAPNTLMPAVKALCTKLLLNSSSAMLAIKATLSEIAAGQRDETDESRARFDAGFTGPDFAEGAAAFLEKRAPKFSRTN
jgi:enoyl-CoA hydratase